MTSRTSWLFIGCLGLILVILGLMIMIGFDIDNRLDDLEARMTTFETVRIEYVAPADDSG